MSIFTKRFKNKSNQSLLAQQLVEFLLVVPFMIMIFGILTEYAYALSINLTLSQGLRTVASSIYSNIRPNMTRAQIDTLVVSKVSNFMIANRAPLSSENNLTVQSAITGNDAFFLATYTYIPAFNLPILNIYFMPKEFHFKAAVVVPAAFLNENTFPSGIASAMLDKIWGPVLNSSNVEDFSSLDNFNNSKRGVMRTSPDGLSAGNAFEKAAASKMLFLVNPLTVGVDTTYQVLLWNGTDVLSGGRVNLKDPALASNLATIIVLYQTLNLIIFDDMGGEDWTNLDWLVSCNSSMELADKAQVCPLKDVVALSSAMGSLGTYDNLNLAAYGPLFAQSNKYKVGTLGSLAVTYPVYMEPEVSALLNLITFQDKNSTYSFGTKVTVVP